MEIYVDKNFIKSEMKKVFEKWDYKMANGFDMYDQEKFFTELVECILENNDIEEVK